MADTFGVLGEALILLRADSRELDKDLSKAKSNLEQNLAGFGLSIKDLGKGFAGLASAAAASLAAIGTAAVASALEIDQAFDTIRTTTGATGQELAGLEQSFARVFAGVPDSAADVATALSEIATRTDLTGQALEDLTTQTLNLARVTGADLNGVIQTSTRMFGDWSIATQDQAAALDYVYKTSQATGAGVTDLMAKVVQFGAPLRQMNFSFEESVALLGKWEKEGVNAELVLGSLRIAMGQFAKAGVDARTGLDQTVKKIQELGPSAAATSLAMQTFGARAGPDMAAAILEGRLSISDLVTQIKGSSETINQAAADTAGFAEKWGEFKNKVTLALEPLGTKLLELGTIALDALNPIIDVMGHVFTSFKDLQGPLKLTGDAFQTLLNISGGLGPSLNIVAEALGKITSAGGLKILADLANLAGATGGGALGPSAFLPRLLYDIVAGSKELADQYHGLTQLSLGLEGATTGVGNALANTGKGADKAKTDLGGFVSALAAVKQEVAGLTAEQKKGIEAGKALGTSTKDIATAVGASEAAVKLYSGAVKESTKHTNDYAEAVKKLSDQYSGANLITSLRQSIEAFGGLQNVVKLTKTQQDGLFRSVSELKAIYDAAGKTMPADLQKLYDATQPLIKATADLSSVTTTWGITLPTLGANVGNLGERLATLAANQRNAAEEVANTNTAMDAHRLSVEEIETAYNEWDTAIGSIIASLPDLGKELPPLAVPVKPKFDPASFGKDLGAAIISAFAGGGDIGKTIGASIGNKIGESIGQSVGKSLGGVLSKGLGETLGKTLGGAIGGLLGPLGGLLGGWIGGLFGGGKKKKEEAQRKREEQEALRKEFAELAAEAKKYPIDIPVRVDKASVEKLKADLDKIKGEVEGLKKAAGGVNVLAEGLGLSFARTIGTQTTVLEKEQAEQLALFTDGQDAALAVFKQRQAEQLAAAGDTADLRKRQAADLAEFEARQTADLTTYQKTQADELAGHVFQATDQQRASWERLGTFILGTMSETIRRTGDVVGAMLQMAPAIDQLIAAQQKFGFEHTTSTALVTKLYTTVKDNKDVFTSLSGLAQISENLGDALLQTSGIGQAFADELGDQFKVLQERGVDTNLTLALMQPQLQKLWELQKAGKVTLNETTQAMLDQAQTQGIVGEKMKDVNERILDVLERIAEALGAAGDEAEDFGNRLQNIKAPDPIVIDVEYNVGNIPIDFPPTTYYTPGERGENLPMAALQYSSQTLLSPSYGAPPAVYEGAVAGGTSTGMLVNALAEAGVIKGTTTITNNFNGTLANEMRGWVRESLTPLMLEILRDSGPLRDEAKAVLVRG